MPKGTIAATWFDDAYKHRRRDAVEVHAGAAHGVGHAAIGIGLERGELRRTESAAVDHDHFAGRHRTTQIAGSVGYRVHRRTAAGELQQAHRVVERIGHPDAAGGIDRQRRRSAQRGIRRTAAIARISLGPAAGDGGDDARKEQLAHARAAVGDIHVAGGVHGQGDGVAHLRVDRCAAIAGISGIAGAGHRGDHTVRRHLAHSIVGRIAQHRHCPRLSTATALRTVEHRAGGLAAIAAVTVNSVAGERADIAVGGDLAHAVIAEFGNVQIAGRIHRHAEGQVELRAACRAAVAAETRGAAAGDRRNGAARDLAHAMVLRVGDIEIARGIDGQPLRTVELGAGRRAAVAGGTGGAGAGEGGDHALAIHAPHHVVRSVRDIRIARGIHGDAERRIDLRAGSRAAVARTAQQPVAGDRADIAAGEFADAVVQRIGKDDVSGGIDRHTGGQAHLHLVGRAAVSGEALDSVADRRGDVALRIDLADAVGAELGRRRRCR